MEKSIGAEVARLLERHSAQDGIDAAVKAEILRRTKAMVHSNNLSCHILSEVERHG